MRASSDLVHGGAQPRGNHLVGLDRLAGLDAVLLQLANLVEHPLQLALVVAQRVLGLLHRDVAAADQRFGVGLADAALGVDDVVHRRLGHRRVVALVVPAAAVAQHVDDDVLLELSAGSPRPAGPPTTHASGSSPLTWKIGAPIIFATSVQYSLDRECSGEVVKPIWLLTMMWMVPPVR